jgi:hypothetical protein
MANNFQIQYTAVSVRVAALKEAKKADSLDGSGTGMNEFVYDHLIAVNEDLMKLYTDLSQTIDFAKKIPEGIADAARRRPSGR